jgi:hypothetical protein
VGWLRSRLALVVCGWLAFDLCLFVSVPVALSAHDSAAVTLECTCEHGDGQTCPMHHTASKSTHGSPARSCRRAFDPAAGLAASLIGPAGVLAPPATVVVRADVVTSIVTRDAEPIESSFVPDSPPPRV